MNNKDSNEIISYVESVFLTAGAERMSKYFFDEVFNDVSCEHILWNQDDLYYIVCLLPHDMTSVEVKSSSALDEGYEYLTTLSLTDTKT